MRKHSIWTSMFVILTLTPVAMAAQAGYGEPITASDSDLGASLEALGRVGQDLHVLRHASGDEAPLYALDINADGDIGAGDLVLSGGGTQWSVGSRIAGSSYAGAQQSGIDRISYLDQNENGAPNTDEPTYWSAGGATIDTSFVRLRGQPGPGQVHASDADHGRPASEQGAAWVLFLDTDGDGQPDADESLYLNVGSTASTVEQGMIRLADASAGSGPSSPGSSIGSYGARVHASDADLGNAVTDLGRLMDMTAFFADHVDCADDRRVALDVNGNDVLDAGDVLVGPGRGGLAAGTRVSAAQASGMEAQGTFGPLVHFVDEDGDLDLDTAEPLYIAPNDGHDYAVQAADRFVRLAVAGQLAGSVLPGDSDEGLPVSSAEARIGYVDEDSDGALDTAEPLYLRFGLGAMDQVRSNDVRLSPAAASSGPGCGSDGAVRLLSQYMDVDPAPVVGQQSRIVLRLENPSAEAQTVTVHVDVRAGSAQRLTQSGTIPAGQSLDMSLGWTPAVDGVHVLDVTVSSAAGSSKWASVHDVVVQPASQQLTLLLSSSLINIGTLEANQTRLLPFEVTAHGATARQVRLEIVEAHGLTARVASPAIDIAPGSTVTLHVEVTGAAMDPNSTVEQRRLILRAVADNGASNQETVDLVVHTNTHGIPGIGLPQAGAALFGAGAVAAFFRRRH